jgi:hypothetical protein
VGIALATLYARRKRDALFDLAWSAAAELSSGWAWDVAAGRSVRLPGAKRRTRFGARRREAFLRVLERDATPTARRSRPGSTARRCAGTSPATRASRSAGAALGRGFEALDRLETAAREEVQERLRRGELQSRIEPKRGMTRDFDHQIRLLRRYERPDGTIGSRRVRHGRMRSMPFEDAIALLDRTLRSAGLVRDAPVEERMKGPGP